MGRHGKNYLTKAEYNARLKVFSDNLSLIRAHDPTKTKFRLALNKFADLTPEEFSSMQGLKVVTNNITDDNHTYEEEDLTNATGRTLVAYPKSVDWRQKGVMNPVRYQGTCGGCYAFSTVNAMEAIYKIKKGSLPSFSE